MAEPTVVYICVIASIGFVMVTLVLYTIATQIATGIERHELVRQARLMRQQYYDAIDEKKQLVEDGLQSDAHGEEIEAEVVGQMPADLQLDEMPQAA